MMLSFVTDTLYHKKLEDMSEYNIDIMFEEKKKAFPDQEKKSQSKEIYKNILNLIYYASNIIDSRADDHSKHWPIRGVDRKRLNELRMKNEGLGMRMSRR